VKMKTHVSVDSVEAMTQLCLHGLGLATPPDYLVSNAITNGELIEVLPEWQVELIPIYAVWHGNAAHNSNIRRLLDFLFTD
jgi:DNA-binding transcriptional LysR family regulator